MSTPTTVDAAIPEPSARGRRLSPDQIRHASFSRTPLGRRGYVEQDVDLLLSRIAADIEGWMAEITGLRAENDMLKVALRDWQSNHRLHPDSSPIEMHSADPHAVQVISRAQLEADALVAQAQDYARQVAGHARQQYDDVLKAAQRQAHEEAERAVQAYRAKAGQQYHAGVEDLERRLVWAKTYIGAMKSLELQFRAAREALEWEVDHLGPK